MCLIVFAWRPQHHTPLVVAANRDEFYARPSLALAPWPEQPDLYAGRDLEAGGTWLGYRNNGRFAALTNIRDLRRPQGQRSRGHLVADFLQGEHSPEAYLAQVCRDLGDYSGFNLLVGDRQQLLFLNAAEAQPRSLAAGIYGLSNASLNSPWPKLERATEAFRHAHEDSDDQALFALLADPWRPADSLLPDTGIGLASEQLLSSTFIATPDYGTRASTLLRVHSDQQWSFSERRFGPNGQTLGETRLTSET